MLTSHFPLQLVSSDIDQASSTIKSLSDMICKYKEGKVCIADVNSEDLYDLSS